MVGLAAQFVGALGRITPRAHVDPVEIGGVVVRKLVQRGDDVVVERLRLATPAATLAASGNWNPSGVVAELSRFPGLADLLAQLVSWSKHLCSWLAISALLLGLAGCGGGPDGAATPGTGAPGVVVAGAVVVLLNNDVAVLEPGWSPSMKVV